MTNAILIPAGYKYVTKTAIFWMTEHWEQIFNTFFHRGNGKYLKPCLPSWPWRSEMEINECGTMTQTRPTSRTAMIKPKRPMALPKISTMRILTKSAGLAASERAAPDPTWNAKEKYYWSPSLEMFVKLGDWKVIAAFELYLARTQEPERLALQLPQKRYGPGRRRCRRRG